MESQNYLRWRAGAIRHLWLHGKAGCGKSVISASIVEDVRSHCEKNADIGCAIFYFAFSDSNKQSRTGCLHSVINQLSRHPSVSPLLERLYKTGPKGNIDVEESLQNILLHGIQSYKKFFLILDGLDESPETDSDRTRQREILLKWLHSLSTKLPMLQILATSRQLPDIEAEMFKMKFHPESIVTEYINVDISKYVINQLNKDRRLSKLDPGMKKQIQDTFTKKAGGM